jgi:hypothetical protein
MLWLNGRACNQQDLVKPEIPVTEFGLGPCAKVVHGLIENVCEGRSNRRPSPYSILFM